VVVARSEIRAVRRVVEQLSVQMLQQGSSVSSYTHMWTRIVMEEHSTGYHHSTPFFLNALTQLLLVFQNTLLTLLWSLVA
jgi:hypothetical protein